PKGKQQHRQDLRCEGRITPGQLLEPHDQPASSTRSGAAFQGGHDVEKRQQAREKHRKGQEGVCQLPALPNARVSKLVVQADWRGQEQEEQERGTSHGIAKQTAPRLLWYQSVPGDVRRQEPEINDWVAREPE